MTADHDDREPENAACLSAFVPFLLRQMAECRLHLSFTCALSRGWHQMQCVLSFSGTETCALPSTCPLSPALFGSFAPHSPPISSCHLTSCSGPSTEPFKQSRSTTHQATILASETTKTRHQKISATKHSAFEKDGKSPFWLESQIGSGSFPEKGARVLKWVIAQTYNPHGPRMGSSVSVGWGLLLSPGSYSHHLASEAGAGGLEPDLVSCNALALALAQHAQWQRSTAPRQAGIRSRRRRSGWDGFRRGTCVDATGHCWLDF